MSLYPYSTGFLVAVTYIFHATLGKGGITMAKKKWKEPELIVMVRNKPEEAVLMACKADGIGGPTGQGAANCRSAAGGLCDAQAAS
jgi:hypothetical protein